MNRLFAIGTRVPRPRGAFVLAVCAASFLGQVGVSIGRPEGQEPVDEDRVRAMMDSARSEDGKGEGVAIPDSLRKRPIADLEPSYVGYGVGEKLVFDIQYGIINAGTATLEVRNLSEIGGRTAYHIVSETRSNKTFSLFYKVRDKVESFIDVEELYSLRFEKHLREGKFKRDHRISYDQERNVAIYDNEEIEVPPRVQDILSALYYVRTLDLGVGQAVSLPAHNDKKTYPLLVVVHRRERVEVDAGTFDCLVVEPILRSPGLFEQKGRLTVWMTDDKYKMPVLMKSKIVVGSISAVLTDYTRVEGSEVSRAIPPSEESEGLNP